MLTPGNRKLGGRRIWGFGLPSGTPDVCPGLSATCQTHCYAVAYERYRPAVASAYRRNLARSHRRNFVLRVRAFLIAHAVRVVRVHIGGDFYSPTYARKWLQIMQRSPRVRFYFYTRAWRVPAIRTVIEEMAALPNCVVWYSCDRETGVPADVPAPVRLAWLATSDDDAPPAGLDLMFRVRRLRTQPVTPGGPPVCPGEDGVPRSRAVTCDRCGTCWNPAPARRFTLPVVEPPH
jgi:hypothetical protein